MFVNASTPLLIILRIVNLCNNKFYFHTSGNKQDAGVQGNIAVDCTEGRPLGLFKEYLDDPVRTKETILGNYYITGDKGYKDKDGYIWFDSRRDDVINSSG